MKKTYAYPVTNGDIVMTFAIMGSSETAGDPTANPSGNADTTDKPEAPGRKLYV